MANLPLEIIEDILCRLPVKSLKRFRAVSKSWCSLIDSERFIKSHLHRSTASCANRRLVIRTAGFYSADLDSLGNFHSLRTPFWYNPQWANVTNSCNGLVLVTGPYPEQPVLWNPFARNYKILPHSSAKCPLGFYYYSKTEYGFGYDSRNDDYKVLKVSECWDEISRDWVYHYTELFSLRLNSWKRVADFPCLPLITWGILRAHVRGSLHTIQHVTPTFQGYKIVAFSVVTETHRDLKMPPGLSINGVIDLNLDVIGGCLCLISVSVSSTDFWVMKDYGVEKSWNKLLSVGLPEMPPNVSLKPLAYSDDKEKVLLTGYGLQLIWYDLRKKTVAAIPIHGYFGTDCVESLVWIHDRGEVR